ncbi:MAG TPA: AraC family transcriptional regulator [Candidatus Paceibacterota bacterium]|nr:AraC family transcriptional regulator [Candidatus Paceibacterota bacterium]
MSIKFEFTAHEGFHFATAFAERFNMIARNDRVVLPDLLGKGFIQEVYLDKGLALCIHAYELKQTLTLNRHSSLSTDILTFKFDCRRSYVKTRGNTIEPLFSGTNGCEVEFGTSNLFAELTIPPDQTINFLVVTTTRQTLLGLLHLGQEGQYIETMLSNGRSFVLHEVMSQEMERTLNQLIHIDENTKLATLLYETKTQDLIYHLFVKLLTRTTPNLVPVDQSDVKKIYDLRSIILKNLGEAPQLPQLAVKIGMSLTRMKQLFRQIFGDSIYNYYQAARMTEAANLLSRLTVSETGYKLGFTNLSHFGRVFEKHFQMKPKRYKDSLN